MLSLILAVAAASAPAPGVPSTAQVATEVECLSRSGVDAPLCLALVYSSAGRFADSAAEFEKAAQLSRSVAATAGDPRADRALAAAGNMWIAAGEPGKAALALDRALAGGGLQAEQLGEALLDRARAAEAQNDLKTARARVEQAKQTISEDPFLWYFSAALAIREGDPATAKLAIGKALTLAPDDPTVLFEAGHVFHVAGDIASARTYWARAVSVDPNGKSGKAARDALALLDKPATVQSEPATTK